VLSSAVGFALFVRAGAAETATRVEVLDRDVSRHEAEIDSLEKAQARDLETFIREVRQIPTKVSAKVREEEPSEAQVDRAVEDLQLLPSERRQIRELLSRARDRGDAGSPP
jgi:redox-regulated HSP33 family molecular chaperone